MAIKSVPRRVTDIEERESILYGFMDDLRKYMKKNDERLDQYEGTIHEIVEIQGDLVRLFDRMDQKLDRMDQKLDDILKPGKNGHS